MSSQKSPRHRTALAYAEQGIPVFPCVVNGKEPATAHGFHDATTDADQINSWWAEADYNLGLCPEDAGWCVVDPDQGNGKAGETTWAGLLAEFGDPGQTYTVRTPRGGRHIYFSGSLPGTVGGLRNGLGPDVDTRGIGSYVVLPPSVINGVQYKVECDAKPIGVPAWVVERTLRRHERHEASVRELDTRGSIHRGRSLMVDYVRGNEVAVEGRGGDTRTYQIACELLNLGLSPEMALELLEEHWNPHCIPPWSVDELRVKIQNASQYAQNEEGAWGVAPASETFSPASLEALVEDSKASERRSKFYPEDETEQDNAEEPSWLIPNLLPDQSTCLMVGASGSYKSFLALDIALSIATQTETFGKSPTKTGPVFYAAAEGRNALKKSRRPAWKLARSVSSAPNFYVMPAPMVALPEEVQEFGDQIRKRLKGRKPALIILDTVAKCMAGMNENDAKDAGIMVRFCDSLVEAFGCTVLALHHKSDKQGAAEYRGSSAFAAGFDTILTIEAKRSTKAVKVGVQQHKDADEPEVPWTFEGKSVANSLVFQPTTKEEHNTLFQDEDAITQKKVGAALKKLGAIDPEHGVTSHVLAGELVSLELGMEERQSLISATAKSLGALSRSRLEAYCVKVGRDLIWCLAG